MDYIKQNTRPNLHKLKDNELLELIQNHDPSFSINNNIENISRTKLVDKIFDLWANYELFDFNKNHIECLICCESLTNGNNLTFECGHKFHSGCIIKHILIYTTTEYKNYLEDEQKSSNKINYNCPQCKKIIDYVELDYVNKKN